MTAGAQDRRPEEVVRRPAGHQQRLARGDARRAAPDHRTQRRGQDHAVQPDHRRPHAPTTASIRLFGEEVRGMRPSPARASRPRAHLPDHHAVPAGHAGAQHRAVAARAVDDALERVLARSTRYGAAVRARRARCSTASASSISPGATVSEVSYGEKRRVEIAMALAQKPKLLLLDEPLAGLSREERASVKQLVGDIPRETTVVMIEHDMDTALDLAEQITVLHYGSVIVEGTRSRSGGRSEDARGVPWRLIRHRGPLAQRRQRALRRQPRAARRVVRARGRAACSRCSAATAPARRPA